jgi:hypothetical protein
MADEHYASIVGSQAPRRAWKSAASPASRTYITMLRALHAPLAVTTA